MINDAMPSDQDIEAAIGEFIQSEFPGGEVLSVSLVDDFEADRSDVLVFRVEFKGPVADFVARAPLSLSRTVMGRLREMNVDGFPFLDFVPTAELRA